MKKSTGAASMRNIVLMISFFAAFLPVAANACYPARLTPEEIIERTDLIIIAEAVKSKWETDPKPNFGSGVRNFFARVLPFYEFWEGQTQFKIHRVLKGDAPEYITVRHNASGAACGVTFEAYQNYLVFVSEHKKKYYTSVFGVRPFLPEDEYSRLIEMLGVSADDRVKYYDENLEPIDAN